MAPPQNPQIAHNNNYPMLRARYAQRRTASHPNASINWPICAVWTMFYFTNKTTRYGTHSNRAKSWHPCFCSLPIMLCTKLYAANYLTATTHLTSFRVPLLLTINICYDSFAYVTESVCRPANRSHISCARWHQPIIKLDLPRWQRQTRGQL